MDKILSSEWLTEDKFKKQRNSCDPNDKINNFGRNLIWLCQSLGILIVSGCTSSDTEGHFKCLTSNSMSVVDYFTVSNDFVVFPEEFSASVCNHYMQLKTTYCDQIRAQSKDCSLPK